MGEQKSKANLSRRKFVVFAPAYNEKQGGAICLHKLVDLLNRSGFEAYLFPTFENIVLNKRKFLVPTLKFAREFYRSFEKFHTNKHFITPVYSGSVKAFETDEWITVYYEQVLGNPLSARNVVRWLLHQPGFHTGSVYYGYNELHVKFNEAIRDFHYPNSVLADFIMPIIHYPLELYNYHNITPLRNGSAYCLRKGKGKAIQHELANSILIDNLPHEKIADIFKRVNTFISYDSYTAYSRFAALCGCDSIVIPDDGVTELQWYPNPEDRFGVAYGFDKIETARETRELLYKKILLEQEQLEQVVLEFADKANTFFDRPRYNLFREKHAL